MAKQFEILNHGADHEQYFPGCGTAFSDYEHVVTGSGDNAVEAYQDAVEQVYQMFDNADKLGLPKRPRGEGITKRDKVPARHDDWWWYVSIRFNL